MADMRRDGALSPVFEFDAHIRYSEVDHRGLLKLPALIDYFQDCSTFQSEALDIGMAWLKEQRRAWVLTHWQIVIDRYPALAEPVSVGTFASAFKGLTASRYFYLRDRTGALIARAHSSWAFMDLERNRPVRPTPEHIDPYGTAEPLDMPAEERRVRIPDGLEALEPITVQRYQIDTNEHVNNCQYVQMALDALPREEVPVQVRVDYKRAAVLGDTIFPGLASAGDTAVVALEDGSGAPYAVVELKFLVE